MYPTLKNGDHVLVRWGSDIGFVEGEIIVFKLFVDGLGTHRLLLRLPWRGRLFFLEGGDAEAVSSILPSKCVRGKILAFKSADGMWHACSVARRVQGGLKMLLLKRLLGLLAPLVERCLIGWSRRAERHNTSRLARRACITFMLQCAIPSLLVTIFLRDYREFSKCVQLLAQRLRYYLSSIPCDWASALHR